MYRLLVGLMVISALQQFHLGSKKLSVVELERASREIVNIDWKPISVFPEEAKRFR